MSDKKKSQKENILEHLQKGNEISPIEALNLFGCFRLADVVFRLKKDGHKFEIDLTQGYAIYKLIAVQAS